MGRTYRYNKDGVNDKYKKDRYLQEQKKRLKRQIDDTKLEKQEKRGDKRDDGYNRYED